MHTQSGRRRPLPLALAALLLLVPAVPATAQRADAESRWGVTVDLGFNGSRGNTRLTVLSTGVGVKHLITEDFRLDWSGSMRYGESEGEVVARNLRSQLGFDLNPEATVSPFFFANAERDRFRRLRMRGDGGAGAKYTFWRERNDEVSFSFAALYSREEFFPRPTGELTPPPAARPAGGGPPPPPGPGSPRRRHQRSTATNGAARWAVARWPPRSRRPDRRSKHTASMITPTLSTSSPGMSSVTGISR
jgi:hypothetical protein